MFDRPTKRVALKPGESRLVNRDECGVNRPGNPWGKGETLVGQYVQRRAHLPVSTSRHAPHVGKKQLAKIAARQK